MSANAERVGKFNRYHWNQPAPVHFSKSLALANSRCEQMWHFLSSGLDLALSFQRTGLGKPKRPDL
jgi:hypothetical protein